MNKLIIEVLGSYILPGAHYQSLLPKPLREWCCYLADSGHSICCILEQDVKKQPRKGYLIPVPVKTVLRKWREVDGFIVVDVPYHSTIGLSSPEEDDEYEEDSNLEQSPLLRIENDGPKIIETNFWALGNPKLYISINAKTFRLLVPSTHEYMVSEMSTARELVISRGPWPAQGSEDAFEFLFDDRSPNPFVFHTDAGAVDRMAVKDDEGRNDLAGLVYVGKEGKPVQVLALKVGYRRVARLPWLKSLNF
jgi:hypothetical protein